MHKLLLTNIPALTHSIIYTTEYPRLVRYTLLTNWQPYPDLKAASTKIHVTYSNPLLAYISSTCTNGQVIDFATEYTKSTSNYYSLLLQITDDLGLLETDNLLIRILSTEILSSTVLPNPIIDDDSTKPPDQTNLVSIMNRLAAVETKVKQFDPFEKQLNDAIKVSNSNKAEIIILDRRLDRLVAETPDLQTLNELKQQVLTIKSALATSFQIISDSSRSRTMWLYHVHELMIARIHHLVASYHDRGAYRADWERQLTGSPVSSPQSCSPQCSNLSIGQREC